MVEKSGRQTGVTDMAQDESLMRRGEEALWEVQHELTSYAFLLKGLGSGAERCEDLYGLGIALDRMATRVAQTAEQLCHRKKRSCHG